MRVRGWRWEGGAMNYAFDSLSRRVFWRVLPNHPPDNTFFSLWGFVARISRVRVAGGVDGVVIQFAKKTGDYGVLSVTDVHLLALTYELECELNHGDWRLLKEPGSVHTLPSSPSHTPSSLEN
jgi:PIN domain of ribonuclease